MVEACRMFLTFDAVRRRIADQVGRVCTNISVAWLKMGHFTPQHMDLTCS